ncbi:hypothetical protein V5N11_003595 [Cardamine amara subsp. amara]|uniref:Uncharacterized protein n=1 Tax=Cardamine amara subsp. amara TaxID=228776 RepID=A0ABD1A657_CARAN
MPESNQISRKRTRYSSSSSSATQILTTVKSQNQRDRSARIALAVSQPGNRSRVIGKIDSKIIRTNPRVTIKDLRLRRVFSPNSISSEYEFNTKGENQIKEQNQDHPHDSNIVKDGIKAANVGGLGNVESEDLLQTMPPDFELLSNVAAVKKIGTNLCSKSVLHPCSRSKIFKNNTGSFSYKRLLPYLMQAANDQTSSSSRCSKPEKSLSQNPPSINFSCNKETEETPEDSKEEVSELMKDKCQLPETTKPLLQSAGSLSGNISSLKRVIVSSPIKKSACSRRKLFRTPGSVNYRRMLPYLRDIQEDNPCVPETVNHPDHEKNTEEENISSLMSVSENEGTQETVTSNVAGESDTSSYVNKEPLPSEPVSVSQDLSDPDKELETQVKHVIPDTEKNLETLHDVLSSEVPSSSPLVGSRSSSEVVASSSLLNTFVDNVVGAENMSGAEKMEAKNNAEQLKSINSDSTVELLEPSVELTTPPSISPSKGILKRSIRGCRGICSCLNCSSFRLNAERAFEFSRNQLQDTEVMVLDLVGEISHLKDMLEKYASTDHNESYKSQAGEAAKRACEAAELAKSRLQQMNDDLQVHSRIPNEQRARVKFAHYVHEKTMNLTS